MNAIWKFYTFLSGEQSQQQTKWWNLSRSRNENLRMCVGKSMKINIFSLTVAKGKFENWFMLGADKGRQEMKRKSFCFQKYFPSNIIWLHNLGLRFESLLSIHIVSLKAIGKWKHVHFHATFLRVDRDSFASEKLSVFLFFRKISFHQHRWH